MNHHEHKQKVKASFDMASCGYDSPGLRFFVESASHLMKILDLRGDENLLDIATGTGHVAIAAAQELPSGNVTGIDLSDMMLQRARSKANELKQSNVVFKCCEIEEMGFDDSSFDVACCAFGIFFLPDMESGMKCVSRVVRPGGKVALTSFTNSLMEPLSGIFLDRLKRYGVSPSSLSWKRLDTPAKMDDLMKNTGLQEINIQSKQIGYYLKDAHEWWEVLWNSGYRGLLSQLSKDDLDQLRDDHLKEIDGLAVKEGIWIDIEVLFAMATVSQGF